MEEIKICKCGKEIKPKLATFRIGHTYNYVNCGVTTIKFILDEPKRISTPDC